MEDLVHVVCPHCATVNRLAAIRLGADPKCGHCHRAIFTEQPVELSQASFRQHIKHNDIVTAVDFWAPWCGPCQMMAPHFAKAAALLEPNMRLAKVNTELEPTLAAEFAIRSIPTLVMFKGGQEVRRQPGAMQTPDIVSWLQQPR